MLSSLFNSSDFEYHNFSIANIAMPAPSMYHNTQHGTTITTTTSHHQHHRVQPDLTIPINIASPKVEKEYDDSVLQRRLKNIESFLQSKIKWVLHDFKREDGSKPTGKNGIDDVDDEDLFHPPAATKRRKNKHRRSRGGDDDGDDDDKDKSKVSYHSYVDYTMLCMDVYCTVCMFVSVSYVCRDQCVGWHQYSSFIYFII